MFYFLPLTQLKICVFSKIKKQMPIRIAQIYTMISKKFLKNYSIGIYLLLFVGTMGTACTSPKTEQTPIQSLTFNVNGVNFDMILIEGGTFMMGCTEEQKCDCEENEKPVHKEKVSSFYIGKYEVTQKLWKAIMSPDSLPSYNTGCEDCPVEQVSWKDAQRFISTLNMLTNQSFRLPTETEWEYAARGGIRSKNYKYSGSNNLDEVAWYINNYETNRCGEKGTTHPVGLKKPNEAGLYDMSGNVWEWCEDWYTKEYHHNGKAVRNEWPLKGAPRFFRRILRGGSWGGSDTGCRVSYIDYDMEHYRDEYGGFRLALEYKAENIQSIK